MNKYKRLLLKSLQIEFRMSAMLTRLFIKIIDLMKLIIWGYWLIINKLKILLIFTYIIFIGLRLKSWRLPHTNLKIDPKYIFGNNFIERWVIILLFGLLLGWQIAISKSNAIWTSSKTGKKLNREIFFRGDPQLPSRRLGKKHD